MAKLKTLQSLKTDRVLRQMRVPENRLMTTAELAARLGMSHAVILRHLRFGTIRSVKIGVRYRVSETELYRIQEAGLPPLTYEQAHGRPRPVE